jgi:glycosyltransferase involved in cell wall biosynthesis
MKKITILFPAFLGGGAEAVCAWILESLKVDFDVTLVTLSDFSLAQLDEQYGTMLSGCGVKFRRMRVPFMHERIEKSFSMFSFRQFFLMRYYKKHLAGKFDLVISAFNEMDFGHKGVQYIYFPMFGQASDKVRSIVGHPDSTVRRIYKRLLRSWAEYSEARMRENITLADSHWVADLIKDIYGVDARVVYPPTAPNFPDIPWGEREDGFVLVSRIVREKNIEAAIRIIQKYDGWDLTFICILSVELGIKNIAQNWSKWLVIRIGLFGKKDCRSQNMHLFWQDINGVSILGRMNHLV